jgi:hypothetical protein
MMRLAPDPFSAATDLPRRLVKPTTAGCDRHLQEENRVLRELCSARKNLMLRNFPPPVYAAVSLDSVFVMQTAENGASYHSVTTPNTVA